MGGSVSAEVDSARTSWQLQSIEDCAKALASLTGANLEADPTAWKEWLRLNMATLPPQV
jgi:hypothetical protein